MAARRHSARDSVLARHAPDDLGAGRARRASPPRRRASPPPRRASSPTRGAGVGVWALDGSLPQSGSGDFKRSSTVATPDNLLMSSRASLFISADEAEQPYMEPRASTATPQSLEPVAQLDSFLGATASKQRKMVRIFSPGSFVEIYSSSQQQWFPDGEVTDICWESGIRDGVRVTAGSSKICYGRDKYFQWVETQHLHDWVRRSDRPKQPEMLLGQVMSESPSWLVQWQWSYFQLRRGVLQLWDSHADAAAGKKPAGSIHLLDVKVEREGLLIKLSSQDHTWSFKEPSEWATPFEEALRGHAAFAGNDELFFQRRKAAGSE